MPAVIPTPLLLPLPEMVTIPGGSFLMGSGRDPQETYVPEFRIGKYAVTNEEFDRYVARFRKTPFALLWVRDSLKEVLVAWGRRKTGLELKSSAPSFLAKGKELARAVLVSSRSLLSPPILTPGERIRYEAYGAYAVFSDWAQERGIDPFSLLIGLMEEMEETCTLYKVVRAVPTEAKRNIEPGFTSPRKPAVDVNWYEAYGYARAVGMRLPTDAEWEKAAKGPEGYEYGTASGELRKEEANYNCNTRETADVGSYPPNGYGLFDMTGNVWEWTARNPSETYPYGVRGGSWDTVDPGSMRVAFRSSSNFPDDCSSCVGFRVGAPVAQDSK